METHYLQLPMNAVKRISRYSANSKSNPTVNRNFIAAKIFMMQCIMQFFSDIMHLHI